MRPEDLEGTAAWWRKHPVKRSLVALAAVVLIGATAVYIAYFQEFGRRLATPEVAAAPLAVDGREPPPFRISRKEGGSLKKCDRGICVELELKPVDELKDPPTASLILVRVDAPTLGAGRFLTGTAELEIAEGKVAELQTADVDIRMRIVRVDYAAVWISLDLLDGSVDRNETKQINGRECRLMFESKLDGPARMEIQIPLDGEVDRVCVESKSE